MLQSHSFIIMTEPSLLYQILLSDLVQLLNFGENKAYSVLFLEVFIYFKNIYLSIVYIQYSCGLAISGECL